MPPEVQQQAVASSPFNRVGTPLTKLIAETTEGDRRTTGTRRSISCCQLYRQWREGTGTCWRDPSMRTLDCNERPEYLVEQLLAFFGQQT